MVANGLLGTHTIIFSSDEIEFVDYEPVTKTKSNIINTPQLLIKVRSYDIQVRGKLLIKKIVSLMVEDYSEHEGIWDFIISERGRIDDPSAPSFIDEIGQFQADSKPVFMSVVVSPTKEKRTPYTPVYGAYSTMFIEGSNPYHSPINTDWLSAFIPTLSFRYGRKLWRGSQGTRMIEAAESDLTTENPASLTLYDFGRSIGVSSRFDCGIRPHLIIEVKKEQENWMSALKKAVIESVASAQRLDKKFWYGDFREAPKPNSNMSSLVIDEWEYSLWDIQMLD